MDRKVYCEQCGLKLILSKNGLYMICPKRENESILVFMFHPNKWNAHTVRFSYDDELPPTMKPRFNPYNGQAV